MQQNAKKITLRFHSSPCQLNVVATTHILLGVGLARCDHAGKCTCEACACSVDAVFMF